MANQRIGVMHVVDSLNTGGTERVAVTLVSLLPPDRYDVHLCTTRFDGPLAELVPPQVRRECLHRKRTVDLGALRKLVAAIRDNNIRIVHAHSSSIFLARVATLMCPKTALIWHDHFGRCEEIQRSSWLYGPATRNIAGVIAVNQRLAEWARSKLRVPESRVWYVPNVVVPGTPARATRELPGRPGARIICVANFRRQKDHPTLFRAMAKVLQEVPDAQLLLVGALNDRAYHDSLVDLARDSGISGHVTFLGQRCDVPSIVSVCDIGVLSSRSEGFPVSVLEYAMASLGVVTTYVGQCAEILDHGRAGLLVAPGQVDELANALLTLLRSPRLRAVLGARVRAHVLECYGPDKVMQKIESIYQSLVAENP
jgi:glycosyltransferase involved in cell wall biosynthesis